MVVFGITGGSGSGKTSVSAIFAELGVEVIDTDAIAREITESCSDCLMELTECFGNDILNSDGTLKRQKLASMAFSDIEKTKMLNSITHKYINKVVLEQIESSKSEFVMIDGAVIIGSIIEPICDFIISVIADRKIRLQRIIERDGLTAVQAKERLDAQPDEDFYRKHSHFIIVNNGTLGELKQDILSLHNKLKEV